MAGLAVDVSTSTESATVDRLVDAAVVADPVRHTILSTVSTMLGDGWCAWLGDRVAARSAPDYPVTMTDWDDVAGLASSLAALPRLKGLSGPAATVETLVATLGRPGTVTDQRLFRCDTLSPPGGVTGASRAATPADRDLVLAWFRAFIAEAGTGYAQVERGVDLALSGVGTVWLWQDGGSGLVAMARAHAVAHGVARIGPVYTPPHHRGAGYGSAVTAAATSDLHAKGAVPVLFTDLANPISNAIYQRLGYRPVGDYHRYTFAQ